MHIQIEKKNYVHGKIGFWGRVCVGAKTVCCIFHLLSKTIMRLQCLCHHQMATCTVSVFSVYDAPSSHPSPNVNAPVCRACANSDLHYTTTPSSTPHLQLPVNQLLTLMWMLLLCWWWWWWRLRRLQCFCCCCARHVVVRALNTRGR